MLIFSACLEMPVNITKYRGSVNFVFRPKFSNFIGHKCCSTNHLYFKLHFPICSMNLVLFLVIVIVVSPRCSFYIAPRNTCTSMLVINRCLNFLLSVVQVYFCIWWCWTQPRTQTEYLKKKTFCHWNLNSLTAHNIAKLVKRITQSIIWYSLFIGNVCWFKLFVYTTRVVYL